MVVPAAFPVVPAEGDGDDAFGRCMFTISAMDVLATFPAPATSGGDSSCAGASTFGPEASRGLGTTALGASPATLDNADGSSREADGEGAKFAGDVTGRIGGVQSPCFPTGGSSTPEFCGTFMFDGDTLSINGAVATAVGAVATAVPGTDGPEGPGMSTSPVSAGTRIEAAAAEFCQRCLRSRRLRSSSVSTKGSACARGDADDGGTDGTG